MTKYTVKPTKQFKKDLKRLEKQDCNLDALNAAVKLLAEGRALPAAYDDHPLKGNWIGHRECHIEPNWLLIYRIDKDVLVLTLSRSGSHSDLLRR